MLRFRYPKETLQERDVPDLGPAVGHMASLIKLLEGVNQPFQSDVREVGGKGSSR